MKYNRYGIKRYFPRFFVTFDRYLSPERRRRETKGKGGGEGKGVLLTPAIKDSNKHLRTIAGRL